MRTLAAEVEAETAEATEAALTAATSGAGSGLLTLLPCHLRPVGGGEVGSDAQPATTPALTAAATLRVEGTLPQDFHLRLRLRMMGSGMTWSSLSCASLVVRTRDAPETQKSGDAGRDALPNSRICSLRFLSELRKRILTLRPQCDNSCKVSFSFCPEEATSKWSLWHACSLLHLVVR
jgi:hypothetical protein